MKTRVVHCKKEPYDVYIGRPSKWGNPFEINKNCSRNFSVLKYKFWIWLPKQKWLRKLIKKELKGKVLGCWCKPKECHGDILAELADES